MRVYTCARKILDRILSRILDAILWPTQQQATVSIMVQMLPDFGRNFMAHAATGPDFGRNFMAHTATGDGKYYGADVALLEFGRRLEYLPQRKEMKRATESEEKRGKEGSGKEGQRAGGQASQANANIIYMILNTHTHTQTHMFSEYRLLCTSLSHSLTLDIISIRVY